jgi:tetratricopeptide (TPR) repeat protein
MAQIRGSLMQGSARIDELRQKFHENPRRYFAPLANEYRKAGDPEQAIAICRAHLAQQPAHMSGHVVYAQALYDAGRVDESRVVFEKALSLDPDNAVVLRQLGDISRQKGDTTEARHWYTRALDADPHDREIAAYIAELTEPLIETGVRETAPAAAAPSAPHVAAPEAAPVAAGTEAAPVAAEAEAETPMAATPMAEAAASEQAAPAGPVAEEPAAVESAEEESAEEEPAEEEPAVEAPKAEAPATSEHTEEAPAEEPAPAPVEETAAPPVEEVKPPEDVEVQIPKTEEPPALTDIPNFEVEEALFAANEDIELFPDTSSPFVTRTMADLYARQGYKDQALEVYRKLAADNPHDEEIARRIRELSPEEASPAPHAALSSERVEESPVETPPVDSMERMTPSREFSEPEDDSADFGFTPVEEASGISSGEFPADTSEAGPAETPVHFTDMELESGGGWDADSWAAGFSSEETEVVPFDFVSSEETISLTDDEDAALEVSSAASESNAVSEASGATEAGGATEASDTAPSEELPGHRADSSLIAETDRTGEFAAPEMPLGILNDAREEIRTEDYYRPFDEAQGAEPPEPPAAVPEQPVEEIAVAAEPLQISGEPSASAETTQEAEAVWRPEDETQPQPEQPAFATSAAELPAEEEDTSPYAPEEEAPSEAEPEPEHFVAYSPQPPDDDDLPHYTPVGPTIREFFATLGAHRPPANGSGVSFTARAAVPDIDAEPPSYEPADTASEDVVAGEVDEQQPDEFPLVSDAFANLFPDSPVSEDDSRAAFALSGALSSQPDQPPARPYATPPAPAPAVEAQPAATQESEEDIRRFREWLDGLAES